MSYYNTNNLEGAELKEAHKNAESQQVIILRIFQRHKRLTASDAWSYFTAKKRVPLTSIRRGITNLAKDGLLEKTTKQKIGMYGKPEYVYQLTLK